MRFAMTMMLAVLSFNTSAQSGSKPAEGAKMDHGVMSQSDKRPSQQHQAKGTVKSVDKAKNTVTMAHGPVPSLKWPAMTMSFSVKDKSLLDRLAANKQVEFLFVQQGKEYVITEVK
jgi:Cu(I)/Ag(I) efflux system protein CusF